MRLTASRLHLADRCPASCALPTAADWADSDAAAAGTGRHAYLSALAATGSREAALATVPDGARIELRRQRSYSAWVSYAGRWWTVAGAA